MELNRGTLRRICGPVWSLLGRAWARLIVKPFQPTFVADYREYCNGSPSRRALVSYLVSPLLPPQQQRDRVMFSNLGIAQQIPRALNELGYIVDVVQYDRTDWRPSKKYDLFIGHGGINFEAISRSLPGVPVHIYFSTGVYWKEWNAREAQRLCEVALRRGYLLAPDRRIRHSEEFANRAADGTICLGNQAAVRTYSQFKRVIGINNAAYPVARNVDEGKDYDGGRRHFLVFSGSGSVHKGLDLLLEAFAGTDLHLHVCQAIDAEFAEVYRYELTECPNIHTYGVVAMRSTEFESLAARCNWVISPTCAEGQPGATLECMAYGLVPVLSEGANIDLGEFGFALPDCAIEAIRAVALAAAATPVDECRRRSRLTAETIRREYTPENFNRSFKAAVETIVCAVGAERSEASSRDDWVQDQPGVTAE